LANMIEIIKKAAMDAVQNSNPTSVVYGKVVSVSPLKIQVSAKLILTESQLVLTRNVTDYQMTIEPNTISTGTTFTVKNGLKTGENVVMIRQAGGQKYIVIDKAG